MLAPSATNVFEWLDIGLTLWEPGGWHEIHERPYALDVLGFELEHGVEAERLTHNRRSLLQARRSKKTVVARHAGFTDLFVPVCVGGRVDGVLVAGPFATERPVSSDVLERWRSLTGRLGDFADPEFARYLLATLSVLVLEGARAASFRRLVECVASLMSSDRGATDTYAEIGALRELLGDARLAERMWEVAHALVDEKTSRGWASASRFFRLRQMGIDRFPAQVVVGLCVDLQRSRDPIDELVRGDAFRRAAVERARRTGNVLSGQAGGQGITLLGSNSSSTSRSRNRLFDLADDLCVMGRRRFGFAVHVGLPPSTGSLSAQYQAAFAAAEAALVGGHRVVQASDDAPAGNPLASIRRELAALVLENPSALPARFNHYVEAIGARAASQPDLARAHLDAAFERVADAFQSTDTLDAKAWGTLRANMDRALIAATDTSALFAVYRGAVSDIARAIVEPRSLRRDRNLRRAEQYADKHFAEKVRLEKVARLAGLTPKYFSELFHRRQGVTFEHYLMQLRVERARQLLSGAPLASPPSLQLVARLSGFSTANYLGRVFRRLTHETPMAYQRRVRKGLDVVPRRTRDPGAERTRK